jgi:RNA polymerase sigma-70 factor (ECF subfamily)
MAEDPGIEADLLRAARAGDRGALEHLLAPYERSLYALCRGMLAQPEDAEDAVQETFLRALRGLPGFRGEASLRTWLGRIAVNVCLEWKRSAARDPEPASLTGEGDEHSLATPDSASPEAVVLRRMRILEALHALHPRPRAVLLLKEIEGWSVAEIGAALGWSGKRVQNELYRARRALAAWRRRDAEEGEKP